MRATIEPQPSGGSTAEQGLPERRSLASDLDVDVCVIGGGLAGLTIARELARRRWDVAVLEAGRIATSASASGFGLVAPGFAERVDRIVERVGIERARALWALSASGVNSVRREAVAAGHPDVRHGAGGCLTVYRIGSDKAAQARVDLLRDGFGADVEYWPAERVRAALHNPLHRHGVHVRTGFHVHQRNYLLGLAAAAEAAGARIFEDTPALALDPAGVRKRIATAAARVRADHIVLATGAHPSELSPGLAATIVPGRQELLLTESLGARLAYTIRFDGAVRDPDGGACYRRVAGDRLLWSGVRADIARTYPHLADLAVSRAWSGTVAYAVHKMPQIGELSPGLWLANAFGDHGIALTAMAGELISGAIAEGDERWRLFAPYGLVWAGGRAGRVAVALAQGPRRTAVWVTTLGARWHAAADGARAGKPTAAMAITRPLPPPIFAAEPPPIVAAAPAPPPTRKKPRPHRTTKGAPRVAAPKRSSPAVRRPRKVAAPALSPADDLAVGAPSMPADQVPQDAR